MRPVRLMIVEDEPVLRRTLECHFREQGYEVLAVGSATAALNRIDEFDPAVVMTDVQMSGMDGLELLDHLREVRQDIDVVVFTGHSDAHCAIEAMKRGASEYLVKPLDLDATERAVEHCMLKQARAARASGEDRCTLDPALGLVGQHPAMIRVYKMIGSVAASRATVLITGETGTGKELVARAIHDSSPAADEPFIAVNCAAVPEHLLESELFGHVRGAFTGASSDRRGKFESAGRGTLFLDEVGDTTPTFQSKLLRVLQEKEFYPLGGDNVRRTDARVVTATHRSIREMVEDGSFREDLFYRLQVIEIELPALRNRRSDIPPLVRHLVARAAVGMGRIPPVIPADVMEDLTHREWPGNIRELENVLTRAVILNRGAALTLEDVATGEDAIWRACPDRPLQLAELRSAIEGRHVQRVLQDTDGNKSEAARVLGISRPTLHRIIRDHQLVCP